jgi:hypothetical protein
MTARAGVPSAVVVRGSAGVAVAVHQCGACIPANGCRSRPSSRPRRRRRSHWPRPRSFGPKSRSGPIRSRQRFQTLPNPCRNQRTCGPRPCFVEPCATCGMVEVHFQRLRAVIFRCLDEARGGIDRARRADRHEQIGPGQAPLRSRPSGTASRRRTRCRGAARRPHRSSRRFRPAACRPYQATTARRTRAQRRQQFAMHVEHPLRPAALVQIVDILRDDQQFARPIGRRAVRARDAPRWARPPSAPRGAGRRSRCTSSGSRASACGVQTSSTRCPSHNPSGPKRGDPALGGYARAGEDHDVAKVAHAKNGSVPSPR